MNEDVTFLMLVGLPASGKSTFAKELCESRDDIVYLSSDSIREEMYGSEEEQGNSSDVFEEMRNRTLNHLKESVHVVYDATNISRKKRRGLLQQLPKSIQKNVCYLATDYDDVIAQNSDRERVVPKEVIDNMYKSLQIPVYSEGWDNIVFYKHDNIVNSEFPTQFSKMVSEEVKSNFDGYELIEFLSSYFNDFFKVYDMPQDSKYHSLSVSRHIYYVYRYVLENYNPKFDREKEIMLWSALLHDVGKGFCKSFKNRKGEETKYANFIGHEYVSSQISVSILSKLGYDDEFIHEVATLVQFHMYLLDSRASRDKLLRYVGEDLYKKLEFLRDADNYAH